MAPVAKLCERCGAPAPAHRWARFCRSCSAERDRERARLWARANPQKRNPVTLSLRTARLRAEGAAVSDSVRSPITWFADRPTFAPVRILRVSVPFDTSFSKNSIYAVGKGGHIHLRQRQRELREAVTWRVKQHWDGPPWPNRKTYLDILVQKPNHKSDAINVLDSICDALKVAIGVDDRWFCVSRLDWEIVKRDPLIHIGIAVDGTGDMSVCSYCGRVLVLSAFTANRTMAKGISRKCRECSRQREL